MRIIVNISMLPSRRRDGSLLYIESDIPERLAVCLSGRGACGERIVKP